MNTSYEVYSSIYDITKKNLEASGNEMAFTKDTFLYSTRRDLKNIDAFDMTQYDNESLLQVLYVALFFRTPEENARINWGKLKEMPRNEFQKKCFQTLTSSQEYLNNGTILYNNIYSVPSLKVNTIATQSTASSPYLEKLYRYYRNLPTPVKNMIKHLLGGKE